MKILYLTSRVPYPINKGDKLRAYYHIKYLADKHEFFLFSIDEENISLDEDNPLQAYCKHIKVEKINKIRILKNLLKNVFDEIPFQTAYFYDKKIKKSLLKELKKINPDIIICQLIRCAEYVRDLKGIPKIIDYVDVISKGLERRMERVNIILKLLLKVELNRVRKYERLIFNEFDDAIIITENDRNHLPINNINKVNVIPNGIDIEFFRPVNSIKEYDLFFSGNLNYPPNVDASLFIVKNILPLVLKEKSDIKVLIGGSTPSKKILKLKSEIVDVKGWVDDIRLYYQKSKIFVAPMRLGTGLQNKLLQAMAMKIPCVVSELTAKGLINEGRGVLLVANSVIEYKEHILKLLNDKSFYNELSEAAYEYVNKYYDWKKIINNLENLLVNHTAKFN